MNRIIVTVVLVGSMLFGITSTWSDDLRPDRDRMRERVETLTMWKIMNALDLDKQKSEKILQIRSDFLKRRKELRTSLHDDFQQLKRLLKESKNDRGENQLADVLQSIRSKRRELSGLWDKQYEAVSKVLPVRKQAELVLLLKDVHREMRSLVLRSLLHRLEEPSLPGGIGPDPGARLRRGSPGGSPEIDPEE